MVGPDDLTVGLGFGVFDIDLVIRLVLSDTPKNSESSSVSSKNSNSSSVSSKNTDSSPVSSFIRPNDVLLIGAGRSISSFFSVQLGPSHRRTSSHRRMVILQ